MKGFKLKCLLHITTSFIFIFVFAIVAHSQKKDTKPVADSSVITMPISKKKVKLSANEKEAYDMLYEDYKDKGEDGKKDLEDDIESIILGSREGAKRPVVTKAQIDSLDAVLSQQAKENEAKKQRNEQQAKEKEEKVEIIATQAEQIKALKQDLAMKDRFDTDRKYVYGITTSLTGEQKKKLLIRKVYEKCILG